MSTPSPESSAAPRPAPQYGEYATPEEVAAILAESGVVAATPAPAPAAAPSRPAPAAGRPAAAARPGARPMPTGARAFDRPATIFLLAFGLFSLIQLSPVLLELEPVLEQVTANGPMAAADFSEAANIAGRILFVALAILLGAAAYFALGALRKGRVAFWIPLTAGFAGAVGLFGTLFVIYALTPGIFPAVT